MHLSFSYNLDKDVENFLKAAKSVNNPKPTKLQNLYIEKLGTSFEASKVKKFIESYTKKNDIDVVARVKAIKNSWLSIEDEFIRKVEKIFGIQYPKKVIEVFLTTNSRCTYNVQAGYFFVNLQSEHTNAIIMHELFHFYTWQVFHKDLESKGVSEEQYNDIKESLTELLNLEFADLMSGAEDKGYARHRNMRAKIKEVWAKNKDIGNLVQACVSKLKPSNGSTGISR